MTVSSEEIVEYFGRYGWKYEARRPDLLRTGFVGDSGTFEVWVRLTEHWVFFIVNPYVLRTDKSPNKDLLRMILEVNQKINLAKFGMDDEGDVVLSVDMPQTAFSYERFEDAMTALSHYADLYKGSFENVCVESMAAGS